MNTLGTMRSWRLPFGERTPPFPITSKKPEEGIGQGLCESTASRAERGDRKSLTYPARRLLDSSQLTWSITLRPVSNCHISAEPKHQIVQDNTKMGLFWLNSLRNQPSNLIIYRLQLRCFTGQVIFIIGQVSTIPLRKHQQKPTETLQLAIS